MCFNDLRCVLHVHSIVPKNIAYVEFYRYTDSVMNYQSMGPSASSFAQFYHQAAAASAVSAASAGVVGGVADSLGIFPL